MLVADFFDPDQNRTRPVSKAAHPAENRVMCPLDSRSTYPRSISSRSVPSDQGSVGPGPLILDPSMQDGAAPAAAAAAPARAAVVSSPGRALAADAAGLLGNMLGGALFIGSLYLAPFALKFLLAYLPG